MNTMRKGSMLVVDDQPNSIAVATQVLRTLGYADIDRATSVEEAYNQIVNKRYAAVFCDWHMPMANGLQLLQELEQRFPRERPKFYFLTIDKNWGRMADARTNGADGFIVKCTRPILLKEKIAKALEAA